MRLRILFLAIALTNIILCHGQGDSLKADHNKTSKFDCAIFPASYIDLIPGERFTPSRLAIDIAENCLQNDLEVINSSMDNQPPIIHENLRKYKRQYFGYYNSLGQKVLIINCFWDKTRNRDFEKSWLSKRIYVLDGGSYFWSIKYNLDTGELFELMVNGHA